MSRHTKVFAGDGDRFEMVGEDGDGVTFGEVWRVHEDDPEQRPLRKTVVKCWLER